MSLATRCTACGTIFRVVLDQLKVSEGWVRCGRCHAVFDAQQGLFDLEQDDPPAWNEQVPAEPEQPAATFLEEHHPGSDAATADPLGSAHAFAAGSAARAALESEPVFDAEPPADPADVFQDAPVHPSETDAKQTSAGDPGWFEPMADSASTPGFVRQAERNQRWQSTPVRLALGLLALALVLGLLAQATHHFRHRIAAQWPATQPWLNRYCAAAGCSIDPLHRIESVSIENSALTAAERADAPGALKMIITLQNRGPLPVAMPALDLSLTDNDGELVARRALLPADFDSVGAVLAPGVDTPLRLNLAVSGRKVSGYTVEVFYP
ncbi:MAG: hypothetical protein B7Y51_12150 [Burkholderiales bacterium 28-67-8]|nr:MAG: hypothetical protein B7Y51_12150 [Burkholderiales bacterium 28-67-8]